MPSAKIALYHHDRKVVNEWVNSLKKLTVQMKKFDKYQINREIG